MIPFNINHEVKVKLTKTGILIMKRDHDELYKGVRDIAPAFTQPIVDGDGYTKFQMWDLMQRFGSHIMMGVEVPFETEILIDIKDTI